MNIEFTLFNSTIDPSVKENKRAACTWLEFIELMSSFTITDNKDDVKAIAPASFLRPDNAVIFTDWGDVNRNQLNVDKWYMLPVDVDGGMTLIQALTQFKDFEYFLHTSHSHRTTHKNSKDCFRMYFPFTEQVSNIDFVNRKDAMKRFVGAGADTTAFSGARAFYLPSCSADMGSESFYYHNHGEFLDIDMFEINAPRVAVMHEKVESTDDDLLHRVVLNLLQECASMDYAIWRDVAWGLKNSGFDFSEFTDATCNWRCHRDGGAADPSLVWNAHQHGSITLGSVIFILQRELGDDCFKKEYARVGRQIRAEKLQALDLLEAQSLQQKKDRLAALKFYTKK